MEIDVKTLNQAKEYPVAILEPGIVAYPEKEDNKIWFYSKEFIDGCIKSLLGKSLTINHIPDNDKDGSSTEAVGIVSAIDPVMGADGAYHGKVLAWTSEAQSMCEKGCGVSVGVGDVTYDDAGGVWHGIKYDAGLVSASLSHLALTDKPRLEGMHVLMNSKEARLYNSKEGVEMFKMFCKKTKELKNSVDGSSIEIDGKQVSIKELVDTYEAEQAEVAKKKEVEGKEVLENASIKYGEKEYKVSDLVNCFKGKMNNAAPKDEAKKEEVKKDEAPAAKEEKAAEPKLENEKDGEDKKEVKEEKKEDKIDNAADKKDEKAEEKKDEKKEKLDNAKVEDDFELLNNAFDKSIDLPEVAPNTLDSRIDRARKYFENGRKLKK